MRIVTTVSAMQRLALGWRREGKHVGLVPTMGYLHDGHVSLIRKARQIVKPEDHIPDGEMRTPCSSLRERPSVRGLAFRMLPHVRAI